MIVFVNKTVFILYPFDSNAFLSKNKYVCFVIFFYHYAVHNVIRFFNIYFESEPSEPINKGTTNDLGYGPKPLKMSFTIRFQTRSMFVELIKICFSE